MKVGIDARFMSHPQVGGFKTYIEGLVSALAATDRDNSYVLYLDRPSAGPVVSAGATNFECRVVTGSFPFLGMAWREQVALARQAARDRVDLLHCPSLTAPLRLACPLVLTIHDMIWFEPAKYAGGQSRTWRQRLQDVYYRAVSARAARRASVIITVSHAAKRAIVGLLGIDAERVAVIYEAPSEAYRLARDARAIDAVIKAHGLPARFILAIGSADPRKNMATLVRAYSRLPDTVQAQYALVIVWSHDALAAGLGALVSTQHLAERVRFVNRVSTDDLVALYRGAALFVFPSLHEGFGLPPLEAMTCGTPVVAANNSSIPEIVGPAALLVSAEDDAEMAEAIGRALTDQPLRGRLIRDGFERAARFSWDRCARQTTAVYARALSG